MTALVAYTFAYAAFVIGMWRVAYRFATEHRSET